MKILRIVTYAMAALLALGEIGRWWGDPRFLPLAFDELAVASVMAWAAFAAPKRGMAPLLAGWGLYCGLVIALLVPALDHLLFGPPKESAIFYSVVLGALLAVGIWALITALAADRRQRPPL